MAASPPPGTPRFPAENSAPADCRALVHPEVRRQLDEFRLDGVVSHLLRRAHFLAEECFMREFSDEAITPRQKAALIVIYQQPGLSQNGLADRLAMDRNTVADMVRRLVAAGQLRRVTAWDDQRAYQLFLTPEGAALLNRVMPRDLQVEERILARLPEEYRPLFMRCLKLLAEADPTHEGSA